MLFRALLTIAVVFLFAGEADAQRFYRRRAMMYGAPGVGVAVAPGVGVSVRAPGFSYGFPSPRAYGARYGWPGVNVQVQAPSSVRPASPALYGPTPADNEYDPSPADQQYAPAPTAAYNLAPNFEPTSATRAGLEGELAVAHAGLNDRLDMFNGGEGWQKYFALDQRELTDPAKTERLLRRMDSVAADPKFEAVSSLDEFQRTRAALQAIASTDLGQAPPAQAGPDEAAADTAQTEAPRFERRPLDEAQFEAIPAPQAGPQAGSSTPPAKPQPPVAPTAGPQYEGGERSVLRDE
ncbi:hypothetical protein Pla123a_18560 [Posidoniimonas polymericola]|uniref:Uncharacterized protein n=1 Tax=Posidoniimonas polymericola TaxID=2528002 RepID=A0A5C5YQJ0_9BACT|nr:hypothetical protein [Posidoniimonas polymericola]TWT77201.1 hypothetical protein Pla123a_18560 [Posidoniimonas polymericola]